MVMLQCVSGPALDAPGFFHLVPDCCRNISLLICNSPSVPSSLISSCSRLLHACLCPVLIASCLLF